MPDKSENPVNSISDTESELSPEDLDEVSGGKNDHNHGHGHGNGGNQGQTLGDGSVRTGPTITDGTSNTIILGGN